jgi:hypothetical protein
VHARSISVSVRLLPCAWFSHSCHTHRGSIRSRPRTCCSVKTTAASRWKDPGRSLLKVNSNKLSRKIIQEQCQSRFHAAQRPSRNTAASGFHEGEHRADFKIVPRETRTAVASALVCDSHTIRFLRSVNSSREECARIPLRTRKCSGLEKKMHSRARARSRGA